MKEISCIIRLLHALKLPRVDLPFLIELSIQIAFEDRIHDVEHGRCNRNFIYIVIFIPRYYCTGSAVLARVGCSTILWLAGHNIVTTIVSKTTNIV